MWCDVMWYVLVLSVTVHHYPTLAAINVYGRYDCMLRRPETWVFMDLEDRVYVFKLFTCDVLGLMQYGIMLLWVTV